MKLDYTKWDKLDKMPAKTRFVKNAIEHSERKIFHVLDSKVGKIRKEMTILTVISIVILAGECSIICFRLMPYLKRLNMFLLGNRKDIL